MRRKKRRRNKQIRRVLTLLLLVIVGISAYQFFSNSEDSSSVEKQIVRYPAYISFEEAGLQVPSENLYSSNAILIRLKDHSILMQKGAEEKIYPASLTKIAMAITAIDNLPDLEEKTKLSDSMFSSLFEANAATAGFMPNEEVSAIDLLYGAMLPSGAECCIGLSEQVSGSEEAFADLMNQKIADYKITNTHFTNTTGLHDDNHYSTVKDLAVILWNALENEQFREIFTTKHYTTAPTQAHPEGLTFYSSMFAKMGDTTGVHGKILGGKTGYTGQAGLCLASLAKINGEEYILVTAGASGDATTEPYHIMDAIDTYRSLSEMR